MQSMAIIVRNWFYRFSRREQYVLLTASLVISLIVIYQVALLPLYQGTLQEQLRTQRIADSLLRVEALGSELASARSRQSQKAKTQPASVAELVDRTLRQHQLVMRGFQPGKDGEARVRLDNVSYAQLMAWLYELEQKQSVQITQLSLSIAQQPQQVNASVSLSVSH